MVEVPEVEEVRALLEKLGEDGLIRRLNSFIMLNEGLETKKGEDFIRVSILGFLEGLLVSLSVRYPENGEIRALREKVSKKRAELDELFRRPAMQNLR